MIHPISYSFPDELWVDVVEKKTSIFASHIPKNIPNSGYLYNDCKQYMDVYRKSLFGITSKKCGWDCWRHLEILSQGAAMFMQDMPHIPPKTMIHYPKALIWEFMNKYGIYSLEFLNKHSQSALYQDLETMLNTCKTQLSSTAMLEYILDKSDQKDAKSIFCTSEIGDYILFSCHYAGKKKYGKSFVTFTSSNDSKIFDNMYKDYSEESALQCYGHGFNYTRLLDPSLKTTYTNEEILQKIKNRDFDTIILMYDHKTGNTNHILDAIKEYYSPNELIVICRNDCDPLYHRTAGWITLETHSCPYPYKDYVNYFQRELGF